MVEVIKEEWKVGNKKVIAQFFSLTESKSFTKCRRVYRDRGDFCHICRKLIKKSDRVAATISNYHGWLPNIIAHYDCLKELGPEGLPKLAEEYEEYKKMKEAWK